MEAKTFQILVVDDTPKNIQLGINILKENPAYAMIFATSGEQALQRVTEYSFDLILLDIIMPDLDGYQVCQRLKENPATAQIPIIFLTARTEQDDIIKGFEVGGVDYITKPFNPEELKARVATHLKLQHYRKEELKIKDMQLLQMQKMESIGLLAAGLSHDFNNLLAIMTGISNSIERQLDQQSVDLSKLHNQFETIRQSGQRASHLIRHLIGIADERRNTSGLVDLNQTVDSIYQICSSSFGNNIDIIIDKYPRQALIQGNPCQLEQMLLNLLINAKHALTMMRPQEQAGAPGRIKVRVAEGRNYNDKRTWALLVEDNGVGISDDSIEKIFQPFYSTKPRSDSSGLGMAIIKTVAENHQGRIDVSSELGQGTTFCVELPCITPEETGTTLHSC